MSENGYDAAGNAYGSYAAAIRAMRLQGIIDGRYPPRADDEEEMRVARKAGHVKDKSEQPMDDITVQKIKRIYGLLWNVKVDRDTVSGVAVSEARKIALSMIDKDGPGDGIEWANHVIPKMLDAVKLAE